MTQEAGAFPYPDDVSREEAHCRRYATPEGVVPEAVVTVRDAEMLAATVRWAREQRRPLVPASSAAPHRRASLNLPKGAWILDFSGMQQVMKIDRRNRVALFEPGVSFQDLASQVRQHGLRTLTSLLPRPGKSALSAYLDREPVIQPRFQWDLADPLLCVEVIFGTGDLLRTGSAGGPGTLEQQWGAGEFQKGPMGPGQNDWMRLVQGAQGGLGLVTWCSAKCEVQPKVQRLEVAGADRLEPLVEASYRQFHGKLTDIHFLVDRESLANIVARDAQERERALREADAWNLIYSVSGIEHFPEERADYLAREARREVEAQGARLRSPPLLTHSELLALLTDAESCAPEREGGRAVHWRDRARGAHDTVYFQTTMDRAAALIARFDELARAEGIEAERVGRYLQPQLGGRCCHLEFIVAADADDAADLAAVRGFCARAAGPLIESGAFFSRPHGAWAEPAMAAAQSSRWIFEEMKEIFDPDHILAPGRLTLGGAAHV
jgi:FAD/FMN-containing dehydrogenase